METGECNLMRCSDSELSTKSDARGHISGERACQDIDYVERNEDYLVAVPGIGDGDAGETWDWSDGKCVEERGAEPSCPPQDVPGFRC